MAQNKKTIKEAVNHWLGHRFMNGDSSDCLEWLPDFIINLINNKFTIDEVETEIQSMFNNRKLDKDYEGAINNGTK